jgi:hypothetical protein
MSLDVANRKVGWGPDRSTRTKSKMPWFPGLRPVVIDVQAEGVNGFGVESRSDRVPREHKPSREGMTPASINGSRTE